MKKLFGLLLGVVTLAGLTLGYAPRTSATAYDTVIDDFSAKYTLSNNDPQGELHFVETIDLTYKIDKHGIYRAIPAKYDGHTLKLHINSVTSPSGAPTSYTSSSKNDNLVLKIGDADKTVTGQQTYVIDYTVQNVIKFYDDHDELYWDINGDQWDEHFTAVSTDITLLEGVKLSGNKPVCYTGAFKSTASNCSVSATAGTVSAQTTQPLQSNQTLTTVIGFEKGYFIAPTWRDNVADYIGMILMFTLPPLLIGGYAINRWLKFGRDPKGRVTIVPEYSPPDNLRPAEIGTVMSFQADQKAITATIIDLAVRGYVRIIEAKVDRKLRKDILEYSLQLTKTDFTELIDYEQKVLEGIFGSGAEQDKIVKLDSLKNEFYKTATVAKALVTSRMTQNGYFVGNSLKSGGRLWVIFVILTIMLIFVGTLFGVALIAGLILTTIIVLICAIAMPARTQKGVDAKEKAKGLELYLKTAEADRIAMMSAPNAPYVNHSAGPPKTVELFEKLLPYAMIFGVEKLWADEFKDIYRTPPDWYSGNMNTFSAVYVASALTGSMNTALATAYSSPSSSGGSGFGGGGFSGGGGGGGGGGSW